MTFKSYLQKQYHYKEETLNKKVLYLVRWQEQVSSKSDLKNLNTSELLKLINQQKSYYTPQALNARIQVLEQYYYYLLEKEEIPYHPLRNFRVKTPKAKLLTDFLSEESLLSIYNNYPKTGHYKGQFTSYAKRNKVILGLIVFQAIRVKELEHLLLVDIDLTKAVVQINTRELPLSVHQILDLQEYVSTIRAEILVLLKQKESTLLFPRSPKTRTTIVLMSIKKKVLKYHPILSIKQLRSSRIVLWLKLYNMRETQYKTGYKSVLNLEKYNQSKLESLKDAVEKHHPLVL